MVKLNRPTVEKGGPTRLEEEGMEGSVAGVERLQVHVTQLQYRRLKQYGVDHRLRVSAIVREAIDEWLARHAKEQP